MKNTLMSIVATAALSIVALNASAADGTITIQGEVLADTCKISINDSTAQPAGSGLAANTVTLKSVSAGLFSATGTVVEGAPVKISYTACTGLSTVQPNFSASSDLVRGTGHLWEEDGPVLGFDLQLSETPKGVALDLRNSNAVKPVAVVDGAADVTLYAGYVSWMDSVSPGKARAVATFTTNYQ